eukprot:SAG31_NODE_1975_length_6751_cov_2.067498_4_plen_46_part_00
MLLIEKQTLAVVRAFTDKVADQVVMYVVSTPHAVVLREKISTDSE